jgi:hypothetical protein
MFTTLVATVLTAAALAAPTAVPSPPPTVPSATAASDRAAPHPSRSSAARDLLGVRPSLYTGKWYSAGQEGRRRCIVQRESNGHYTVQNSSGYQGAYQFGDSDWRVSLTWMMLKEEPKGSPLRPVIRALRDRPIKAWNRYWQDRAFWTAWRFGAGQHHWSYPPKPC